MFVFARTRASPPVLLHPKKNPLFSPKIYTFFLFFELTEFFSGFG